MSSYLFCYHLQKWIPVASLCDFNNYCYSFIPDITFSADNEKIIAFDIPLFQIGKAPTLLQNHIGQVLAQETPVL